MNIPVEPPSIYLGPRDSSFKELIKKTLEKGNLDPKYIDTLLSEENMHSYAKVFTSKEVNPQNNYETFEQMGDGAAANFLSSYFYKRFPQLDCAIGVKVVARLKINYGAKESFYPIAEKLGFWQYISASTEERLRKKKSLLEDVLEAFLGATQWILDNETRVGVGYAIAYDILKSIFDEIKISLKYDDLYDNKTKLKEIFDANKNLGALSYKSSRENQITTTKAYRKSNSQEIFLGEGRSALQKDAEQKAAGKAIIALERQGYKKKIPPEYDYFCEF